MEPASENEAWRACVPQIIASGLQVYFARLLGRLHLFVRVGDHQRNENDSNGQKEIDLNCH